MYQTCDPGHPDHRPEFAGEFTGFFREFFEAQDAAMGELMESVPDDTFVIVFSGSGVRPNYSANHLLPDVLNRLGVGPKPASAHESPKSGCSESARSNSHYRIRRIQDRLSTPLISSAKKLVPGRLWDKATRRVLFAGSDWASSRAFCIPNDYCGSIRVNLKGREPRGTVDPGEYDGFCDELAQELLTLTNETTGRPAVQQVIKIRNTMMGNAIDALPDLSVVWADDAPITGLQSLRIGTVRGKNPERRTGAHHPTAFVLLCGPGIPQRRTIVGARLIDLAPTILRVMGVPDTKRRDGVVLDLKQDDETSPSIGVV
jgi:predicted AlkP superfamily phosphohydrolase/phosphomutase